MQHGCYMVITIIDNKIYNQVIHPMSSIKQHMQDTKHNQRCDIIK
jgi:hypothetical protein